MCRKVVVVVFSLPLVVEYFTYLQKNMKVHEEEGEEEGEAKASGRRGTMGW